MQAVVYLFGRTQCRPLFGPAWPSPSGWLSLLSGRDYSRIRAAIWPNLPTCHSKNSSSGFEGRQRVVSFGWRYAPPRCEWGVESGGRRPIR